MFLHGVIPVFMGNVILRLGLFSFCKENIGLCVDDAICIFQLSNPDPLPYLLHGAKSFLKS